MIPAYATRDDLIAYTARNDLVTVPADADGLLLEAERMVDRAAGPWPAFSDGRKFDPPSLTAPQQAALARATSAAAEWLLMLDTEEHVGITDFLPEQLSVLRRAGRTPPRMIEELAGSGLVIYVLTAASDDGP